MNHLSLPPFLFLPVSPVLQVLSQFGVLEFLHSHAGAFASCSRSVEHYQLGYKAVHSVKEVDTVIDAFRLMLKANVSGVALVNNLGEVVGTLTQHSLIPFPLAPVFTTIRHLFSVSFSLSLSLFSQVA
jgi:predicted transcriptional regulator